MLGSETTRKLIERKEAELMYDRVLAEINERRKEAGLPTEHITSRKRYKEAIDRIIKAMRKDKAKIKKPWVEARKIKKEEFKRATKTRIDMIDSWAKDAERADGKTRHVFFDPFRNFTVQAVKGEPSKKADKLCGCAVDIVSGSIEFEKKKNNKKNYHTLSATNHGKTFKEKANQSLSDTTRETARTMMLSQLANSYCAWKENLRQKTISPKRMKYQFRGALDEKKLIDDMRESNNPICIVEDRGIINIYIENNMLTSFHAHALHKVRYSGRRLDQDCRYSLMVPTIYKDDSEPTKDILKKLTTICYNVTKDKILTQKYQKKNLVKVSGFSIEKEVVT